MMKNALKPFGQNVVVHVSGLSLGRPLAVARRMVSSHWNDGSLVSGMPEGGSS